MIDPARDAFYAKTGINRKGKGPTLFRILRTWVIIFTGELFFRANGLNSGVHMFLNFFHGFGISRLWDGSLLNLGVLTALTCAGIVILAVKRNAIRNYLYGEYLDRKCLKWFLLNSGFIALAILMALNCMTMFME